MSHEEVEVVKIVTEGPQGPQGTQGPQGPQGPAGPGVDLASVEGVVYSALQEANNSYTHEFAALSSEVIIHHGLGGDVNAMMVDDTGQVVSPVVKVIGPNTLKVSAGETLKGHIIISKL